MKLGLLLLAVFVVLGISSVASAAIMGPYSGSVSFTSDTEADKYINLPSFNTVGGTYTLTGVSVKFYHSGSADIQGDNDDTGTGCTVKGRIIRGWDATGPDVSDSASKTVNSAPVDLSADNGDLLNFDNTAPDGTTFGGPLSYSNILVTPTQPSNIALYATNGPGTVTFTIGGDDLLIVNDQAFVGASPNAWQLQVENPLLTVKAEVTYTYTPEPATMTLLGLGALGVAMARRRRRSA